MGKLDLSAYTRHYRETLGRRQEFRLRDDVMPSLTDCVSQHGTFLAVGTAAAVMRAELGAELREELRAEFRRPGKYNRNDDGPRANAREQKALRGKSGGKRPRPGRHVWLGDGAPPTSRSNYVWRWHG
ncbi:hypothetical protein AB1Y20_003829 [Prymnesium parvum]|uniref:Uncharacterized protein n=1 Tax=Prymnesium parvum TaxID=97485 RepID=A0AB34J8V9_PRYPA